MRKPLQADRRSRPPTEPSRRDRRGSFAAFVRETVASDVDGTDASMCQSAMTLLGRSKLDDRGIGNHLGRTSVYAHFLALEIGLGQGRAHRLGLAACLHDVGKIGMSPALLQKIQPLDPLEWEQIKQHTLIGARLLTGSRCRTVRLGKVIAATHHEKWDGSGYPFGLRCDQIPLASRLVTLADQYDALRSRRAYRRPFDHSTSCEILQSGDDRTSPCHFDPDILRIFGTVTGKLEELAECTATYN